MLDTKIAYRTIDAARRSGTHSALPEQERRRGLLSFLTWPFFLGALFGHDALAAGAVEDGDHDVAAPKSPDAAPAFDANMPPDPSDLANWEPNDPNVTTYLNLIAGRSGPPSAPGGPDVQPSYSAGGDLGAIAGGGSGGGGHGGGSPAHGHAASGAHVDTWADDGLDVRGLHLSLDLGQAPVLGDALQSVGDTLDEVLGELPLVGRSLQSLLGPAGDIDGGETSPFAGSGLTDTVSSGGSLVFSPSTLGSGIGELYAHGRYTDYGVTMRTTLIGGDSASGEAAHDHADVGISVDLGHGADALITVGVSDRVDDDASMRTPLDVLS